MNSCNNNKKLAASILQEIDCRFCEYKNCCRPNCEFGLLKMAELKDKALKEFLLTHMDIPYTGSYGENGHPLALDYIEWVEEKDKKAQEMFEKYKEYEDKYFT